MPPSLHFLDLGNHLSLTFYLDVDIHDVKKKGGGILNGNSLGPEKKVTKCWKKYKYSDTRTHEPITYSDAHVGCKSL